MNIAVQNTPSWKALCFFILISFTFFQHAVEAQVSPPSIFVHPKDITVEEHRLGAPLELHVLAHGGSGIPLPSIQWQRMAAGTSEWMNLTNGYSSTDNLSYSGTTTGSLTVSPFNFRSNGDRYRAVLTNEGGTTYSNSATITVILSPIPTNVRILPPIQSGTLGASFDFTVSYETQGYPNFYWFHNGTPISGSNTNRLTITNAQLADAGSYTVVVSNSSGSVTSAPATLTIEEGYGAIAAIPGGFINGQGELWQMEIASPSQTIARPLKSMSDVAAVEVGGSHTLVLKTDGTLWGSGSNASGQLGLGEGVYNVLTPTLIAEKVASIACGENNSFFIKTDGTLWGMGSNSYGPLGIIGQALTPKFIASDVMRVASGDQHTLVLKTDGSLWGTGLNHMMQLGDTVEDRMTSVLVLITTNVQSMAASRDHSLFIKNDHSLWGMGSNAFGQLGIGSTSQETPVTKIADGVRAVSTSNNSTFIIKIDDTLWAMGDNRYHSLGDGTTTQRETPTYIASEAASIGKGSFYISKTGELWGWSGNGLIGRPPGGTTPSPILVTHGHVLTPQAPIGMKAETAHQGMRLQWSHTLTATSYEVWRGTQDNPALAVRIGANIPAPIYLDASAQPDVPYYYWIKARNLAGTSPLSAVTSGSISSIARHQLNPLYTAIVQRKPLVDEYAQYLQATGASQNLALVTTELMESEEYQERQWELVIRLYIAANNRPPDYAALQAWSELLRTGGETRASIATRILQSADFRDQFDRNLSSEEFIALLYRNTLGREATQADLNYWESYSARDYLLLTFADSDEYKARLGNTVRIVSLYTLLYHRPPTDAELASWKDFLRGLDFTDLFLESVEFQTRFPSGLNNVEYINLMFQGFLRRGVDSAGLFVLASELQAGITTRAQLLSNITDSPEFTTVVAPVIRFYLACLNRTPDIGGLNHWTFQVRSGMSIAGLADAFALSAEFNSRYGGMSNSQFVSQLYFDTLNRAPDSNGLSHWTHQLNTSAESRATMLLTFANSAEAVERFQPRIRTFLHYSSFLLRSPAKEELDHWDNYLSTLEVQFIEELLRGPEFQGLHP